MRKAAMNFHNPAQLYFPPGANACLGKQLSSQKVFSLSGERKLWLSVGKALLFLGPMFLAVNMWLASSCNQLAQSLQAVENVRYELLESQSKLTAKRAQLLSPERVLIIAAEKLSLHVPEKEQVMFF
jgi:hypothetical protein